MFDSYATTKILCHCCETPVAEIGRCGSTLVIRAKHHGEHHVTELNVLDIMGLLSQMIGAPASALRTKTYSLT